MAQGTVHIGTSGWQYRHWVGPFYPRGTAARGLLKFYVRRFASVEINSTFYGLPKPKTLATWYREAPPGFVFACKASRYITHMKKLRDPGTSTTRFFTAVAALGEKLGPMLFQLPPRWRVDPARLSHFLDALPGGHRYAFEFRDASWLTPEIYALLGCHGAALCIYDLDGTRSPVRLTADFAYVRLHGPDGPYRGRYDGRTLAGWARRIRGWRADRVDVYCYFDNDENGYAAGDAARLAAMVDGASDSDPG